MLTYREFLNRAKALGVKEDTEDDGDGGRCPCLRMGDGPPIYVPTNIQLTDPVQRMQLASWCRDLGLDPEKFDRPPTFTENPFLGAPWDWD